MKALRAILAILFFAASGAAFCGERASFFKTSFLDLVEQRTDDVVPEEVTRFSAGKVSVVVSASEKTAAVRAADEIYGKLSRIAELSVNYRMDCRKFDGLMDFIASNRFAFVCGEDRELLKTAQGRKKIARRALRRFVSSPLPTMLPPSQDPFLLTERFITSFRLPGSNWRSDEEGILCAEYGGRTHLLIAIELPPGLIGDIERLDRTIATIRQTASVAGNADGVSVAVCGVPCHTALSASRCQNEMAILAVVSVCFIILLSLAVFRTWRWLVPVAISITLSCAAGFLALVLFFGDVHVVSLVIGTSLLGLAVDYSFHSLLYRGETRDRLVKNLSTSCITTVAGFVPFFFSSLPVLRQSAAFICTGLLVALASVLWLKPPPVSARQTAISCVRAIAELPFFSATTRGARFLRVGFCLLFAILAVWGICRAKFETRISSLYQPPQQLARDEKLLRDISNAGNGSLHYGMLVTIGNTLDEMLVNEKAAIRPECNNGLSAILPTECEAEALFAGIRKLYDEQSAAIAGALNLELEKLPQCFRPKFEIAALPAVLKQFVAADGLSVIVPFIAEEQLVCVGGKRAADSPSRFVIPEEIVNKVLSDLNSSSLKGLMVAYISMFVIMLASFGKKSLIVILPSIVAIVSVIAALGIGGEAVNVFHILAMFLIAGLGIDYAIFMFDNHYEAILPVLCSLFTSMVAFGMLSFVSLPVVHSFGSAIAVGLPVIVLACLFLLRFANWSEARTAQTAEIGASRLGLEILYWINRIFGLRALHFLSRLVAFTVWCTSSKARKASRLKKTLNFAISLADKFAVLGSSRVLPRVRLEDTIEARQFEDDIAKKGVFILSSHIGTIEVLSALGDSNHVYHGWMEFSRTGVFNDFYLRHSKRGNVKIHSVSEFGMGSVFEMGDILERGDSIIMAGDRGFGRNQRLSAASGRVYVLPEGVFRLAANLGSPVYFAACVHERGKSGYVAKIKHLDAKTAKELAAKYVEVLDSLSSLYPDEHFVWE